MALDRIENCVRVFCGVVGLLTLFASIFNVMRGLSRPAGRMQGSMKLLEMPFIVIGTLLFFIFSVVLWKSLPFKIPDWARIIALVLGSLLFFSGIALYLSGMRTLRELFGASSGFGVKLFVDHRLIQHGPYSFVRHPMYLAVIVTGLGGALIYRTWAMALFAVGMFGLILRAKREEQILEEEFGAEWSAYKQRVPGWFPRINKPEIRNR